MEKNGNYLPIDRTLTVLYIFSLLDNYDLSIKKGNKPLIDPYRQTLYMRTDEDKYVEIPDDLRRYAIQQWLQERKIEPRSNDENDSLISEETILKKRISEEIQPENKGEKCISCRKERRHKDRTLVDTTFQLILCLVIIFTILYTLSLVRRGVLRF